MVIGFIPVRGGSKSIPEKNIKNFCGKPLVFWSLEALQNSGIVDKIIVATDSGKIKKTVRDFNFDKVELYDRDPKNARDHSSTEDVMLEYIHKAGLSVSDVFILVQATNPFIQANDISQAMETYTAHNYDSLLSVTVSKRFFWQQDGSPLNYDYQNRPRRQDYAGLLLENGAFYINSIKNIRENANRLSGSIGYHIMPEFTSFEIDEEDDWIICEQLMQKNILAKRLPVNTKTIKAVLTDVDGVLTDAGMYYSESGDELKKFNTHDGKGFELLRNAGFITGIITSENTQIVANRAKKLKVNHLFQGALNKLDIAREICQSEGISLDNIAYIGDDSNDRFLLEAVGLAACPANARAEIKEIPDIIHLQQKGGDGAFREFAEIILKHNPNTYTIIQ